MRPKSGSLRRSMQLANLWLDWSGKEKRQRRHTLPTTNDRSGIRGDSSDVKMMIILWKLYAKKVDNLYKMNIFIKRYRIPMSINE